MTVCIHSSGKTLKIFYILLLHLENLKNHIEKAVKYWNLKYIREILFLVESSLLVSVPYSLFKYL